MKKIISLFCLAFSFSLLIAQSVTIFDPTIKATASSQHAMGNSQSRLKGTSEVTTLTFEGCGNMAGVGDYYNGGAGGNYGITWSANSLSLISASAGGGGNFCDNSTPPTCLFFTDGVGANMSVAAGFTTGFSFYYSSAAIITITVWDGPDGTGNILTTQVFPANNNTTAGPQYTCNCGLTFCHWDPVGVAFAGTAKSVTFGGAQNQCGFDDVTLGASSPLVLPTVVTTAATAITGTGATLNGTVNANGVVATVSFEYGLTTAYGSTVPAVESPVSGSNVTNISTVLAGLAGNTTYHYRAVGVNANGRSNGSDLTFTTPAVADPPVVVTVAPTSLAPTSAKLNGTVNAKNSATTVTFEWGLTNALGNTITGIPSPVNGNIATAVSVDLTGLTQVTTYYYRCIGVNAGGTTNGSILSFTTPCPAIPQAGPISGPAQVCPNSGGHVYTIDPVVNATSYNWTLPLGATISNGAGTNRITVSFGTISGQLTVRGINACAEGAASTLAVEVFPALNPGAVSANQTICYNTRPAVMTVANPTGGIAPYNHQWQYSFDNQVFTNIAGATGTSYQPAAIIRTTYYRVQQGSSTGCVTVQTGAITVEVLPPMYAVELVGNQMICENTTPVELVSLPAEEGPVAYFYQWQVSDDDFEYTDIPGATGTTYQPEALANTQYYRMKKISPLGCGVRYSDPVVIRVNQFPKKPGQINGPVSGFVAGIPLTFWVNPVAHAAGYEWVLPHGTTVQSGANTNRITITFPMIFISGQLYVRGVNTCGFGPYSANYVVSVSNAPDQTGITGSILDEVTTNPSLNIYPVPNEGRFNLVIAWGYESQVHVEILTLTGVKVTERFVQTHAGSLTESFDVSSQPAGIYLIRARDHKISTHAKVIISK